MNLVRMWQEDAGTMTASCDYDTNSHEFLVSVCQGDKVRARRFRAIHEPRFGMDVAELAESQEIAEELAVALENEE